MDLPLLHQSITFDNGLDSVPTCKIQAISSYIASPLRKDALAVGVGDLFEFWRPLQGDGMGEAVAQVVWDTMHKLVSRCTRASYSRFAVHNLPRAHGRLHWSTNRRYRFIPLVAKGSFEYEHLQRRQSALPNLYVFPGLPPPHEPRAPMMALRCETG